MKKIIAVFSALVVIFNLFSFAVFANTEDNISLNQTFINDPTFVLGNANGDDKVDAHDSFEIVSYICGNEADIDMNAADILADGSVNAKDNFYLKASFVHAIDLNSLENGKQLYSFNIGGVPVSQFVIVLPEEITYDDNIYYAYELLQEYINKATGISLNKAWGTSDSEHTITFHNVELDSKLGQELGREGYRYTVKDGKMDIYGTISGNMYAVYEILEDYLGFYFMDSNYTFSFKGRYKDIEEGTDRTYVPPLCYRHVGHTYWGSTKEYHYYARRLNSSGSQNTGYYGKPNGNIYHNAHSFFAYLAMGIGVMPEDDGVTPLQERYYSKMQYGFSHPTDDVSADFLSEKGLQPCASNDTIFNILFDGLVDTIEMMKARGYDLDFSKITQTMSFSINDNDKYCMCRICDAKALGETKTLTNREVRIAKESLANYTGKVVVNNNEYTFSKEGYTGVYVDLANRMVNKLQDYYPGIKLYQILYSEDFPEIVRPDKNLVLCYCAGISGCFYHYYGNCDSCIGYNAYGDKIHPTKVDEESIIKWADACHASGAKLYYWYYPENYMFYLFDLPVYRSMYYTFTWLYSHGIDGIYYEGSSDAANVENWFEHLKAYLGAELEWNPKMTYEEYTALTKKFMYAYYGKGYEHIYNLLMMLEDASDAVDYCCTYYFRAFDIYSKSYLAEHYEAMRHEIEEARKEANVYTSDRIDKLLYVNDFLCLSAKYEEMYVNGNAQSKALYKQRYDEMLAYFNRINIKVTDDANCYDANTNPYGFKLPKTADYSKSPMDQVYVGGYRHTAHDAYAHK